MGDSVENKSCYKDIKSISFKNTNKDLVSLFDNSLRSKKVFDDGFKTVTKFKLNK